jgi:uncharacterized protein YdeI (YjbR/CyaY-like superfamily)
MPKKDPRVDAYIAKAQPFAQPILKHLRKLVHQTCPEVQETIKWSFAAFDYKGIFCSMASFKEHCTFGFWKTALLKDPKGILDTKDQAMGSLGRITSLADLPSDKIIIGFIKQAMELNDKGVKLPPRKKTTASTVPKMPLFFKRALEANKKALTQFEKFPPGQKKEYIVWLSEAKTEATRKKRLETAIGWISEGKIRNWKYLKK